MSELLHRSWDATLLADQKGRLAIISAEGGVFDIIAGRYNGNIPNMDVWLKGHSGDMIRIDRKGRPPEYIRKPALTLGLMIQPEVLKSIAAQRAFRGRGLVARFLYALPVSQVGYRKTGAPPLSETVRTATTLISRRWQQVWSAGSVIPRCSRSPRRRTPLSR
jgi:replicative DNA helicase